MIHIQENINIYADVNFIHKIFCQLRKKSYLCKVKKNKNIEYISF